MEKFEKEYHDNGELMHLWRRVNGVKDGLQIGFHDNGNLDYKNRWKDGKGQFRQFFNRDATRYCIETWKRVTFNGIYVEFNYGEQNSLL